jgi:putative membrane protein
MKRLVLFLKGVCMGIADVIPGVSGGTLALILGVYKELVDSIKGLTPKFLVPLFRWLKSRDQASRDELLEELRALNLGFLITLGSGIAVALGIGSVIIPYLMENAPVETRAFFFGLIVASVWVPFRMINFQGAKTAGVVAATALFGLGVGWFITNPANTFETTTEWFEVTSEGGDTLKDLTRKGPSAMPSAEVFWAEPNEELRHAIQTEDPEVFARLEKSNDATQPMSKDAIKERSAPYDALELPAGTPVKVPRPELWFVFLAGMIAICAMILPGISGSYILLILGTYFFILNALKGFIKTLASGAIPVNQTAYVVVFCIGAGIGLLSFARVLSYLLRDHPVPTLGALVGLMVGCLRGIWPFRATVDGVVTNVLPSGLESVAGAGVTFVVGLLIVGTFTWLGRERVDAAEVEA